MAGDSDGEHEKSQLLEPAESSSDKEESGGRRQERARVLERLLDSAGYGLFHVLVILVSALAISAEAVEIMGAGFVVPIAEEDLDLDTARKGYLNASIFVGMLVGGLLWGSLADVLGRRVTLFFTVLLNGVCGLLAAFSPNFFVFLFLRLASGVGIGGSFPIVHAYVSEFFPEKYRGPAIILLAGSWTLGTIYSAALAWGILGMLSPIDSYVGSLHFVNWRLFLILCTIPAFLFVSVSPFLPNSPAYLFHNGQEKALHVTLMRIHRVNSLCSCCCHQPETGDIPLLSDSKFGVELHHPSNSLDNSEHTVSHTRTPCSCKSCCTTCSTKIKQVVTAVSILFSRKYLLATLLLMAYNFALLFANYGLALWVPEYFKRLLEDICNQTDFAQQNCNNTNLQLYQDTLFAALSALPGVLAGLILINLLGGKILAVLATLISSLGVFIVWGLPNTHSAALAATCLFSATLTVSTWAMCVIMVTLYDVTVRATSQGLTLGVGRIGGILGNVMFGYLLDVGRTIPLLIVALVLVGAAGVLVFLPPIYRPENRPPLEKAISHFRLWFRSKL